MILQRGACGILSSRKIRDHAANRRSPSPHAIQPAGARVLGPRTHLWRSLGIRSRPGGRNPRIEKRYGLVHQRHDRAPRSGFDSIAARRKKIADIALAFRDVDAAYQAARTAFESWSKIPGRERGKYLFRIARLLQDRAREFAVAETIDGGKPIKEIARFRRAHGRGAFLLSRRLGGQAGIRRARPQRLLRWASPARSSRGIFRC